MPDSHDETPVAPDRRTLLQATGLALGVAAVVLVVAVLPAEYGVDPTGVGGALGLTELAEATPTAPAVRVGGDPFAVHEANVTIPAGDSLEWKLRLDEGAPVVFSWRTRNGTALFTDLHGEPAAGPEGEFTSWNRTTTASQAGDLRAPFTGTLGWYWENDASAPATVHLRVAGTFQVEGVLR